MGCHQAFAKAIPGKASTKSASESEASHDAVTKPKLHSKAAVQIHQFLSATLQLVGGLIIEPFLPQSGNFGSHETDSVSTKQGCIVGTL